MFVLTDGPVVLIAGLHLYFLWLEMVLWTKPKGRRLFGLTPEFAKASATLAANQGLYNGFLAAGLIWSVVHPAPAFGTELKVFFLLCVLVAGVYGGFTVNRKIMRVQAAPAVLALALVFIFEIGSN